MNRLFLRSDRPSEAAGDMHKALGRRIEAYQFSNCPVEQCLAYVNVCLAESCGKCVPCRIGLKQVSVMLTRILDGDAEGNELEELRSLAETIKDSADCAIGFETGAALSEALRKFEEDFKSHIQNDRCIASFNAVPCSQACPSHVDIPGYIALVKAGRYDEAVQLIRYDNPLVSTCALICEHPCELSCRRKIVDDAINIRAIKRMAVDNANNPKTPEPLASTGKRIAVIGGGPSGLTAAYYLRLMGHDVTIFEQRRKLGGMTRYGIPRYRLPESYLDTDINAILSTGINVETGVSIDANKYADILKSYDAVYISIGAHNANTLGIEGEDAPNVMSAVALLRDMGDDEKPDFKGRRVVIVGGGNVAMDCTRTAARLGAADVKCVYRRRKEDMTAQAEEIEGAIAEVCEMVTMKAPVRIEKDEDGRAVALIVQPQIPGAYDRGRPKPVKADLPEERIECDIIVCAIGQAIGSEEFEAAGVPVNRRKIVSGEDCKIDSGHIVYTGGDCMSGPATVIRAIAAGKAAAANIDRDLGFDNVLERNIEIPPAEAGSMGQCGRINLVERAAYERRNDFDIMERAMTLQECKQECSRCLRCDHNGMGALKGGRSAW